jgi:hypothetical protein
MLEANNITESRLYKTHAIQQFIINCLSYR